MGGLLVLFPAGSKDVHDQRVFQRGRFMLDAATDNETVPCSGFESGVTCDNLDPPVYNVYQLFLWVTMSSADPTFLHAVLYQHEFVIVCTDAASEAWFGTSRTHIIGLNGY
jgi:hypothetical protein